MKSFDHFNQSTACPICGLSDEGMSVLIPIDGTGDGRIAECLQVHLDCIDIRAMRENGKATILYQMFNEINKGE